MISRCTQVTRAPSKRPRSTILPLMNLYRLHVAPGADADSLTGSPLGIQNLSRLGNPNLQPETAKSFQCRVYIRAKFPFRDSNLTAVYFSIDFDNEITYLWQNPFWPCDLLYGAGRSGPRFPPSEKSVASPG